MSARSKPTAPARRPPRPGAAPAGRPQPDGFPIVGVGASAGGLEAFRELLANVPADAGLAFVLVQHLDATHTSRLSEALAQATTMKVAQAEQGERVERNRVYVIPPGVQLGIEQGVLRLVPLARAERRPHLPIDFFFRSLAADRGRRAIGVILSGSASDGSAGLAEIRAQGGITLAQEPGTARYGEMPRSAVEDAVVDLCLPLPALGAALARLARHPSLDQPEPAPSSLAGGGALAGVMDLVHAATGVDFGEHKPDTFRRRLSRRMAVRQVMDVAAYLELLQQEPGEVLSLYEDLLIGVTSFFRDEGSLAELTTVALPELLRRKPAGAPIRAWVVGCATGEEVYSLAISILEQQGRGPSAHPILVFGSDLSERAIATARGGFYPDAAVRGIGEERLQRFFVRSERGWRVTQAVRDLCVFVRHDVARDPPFSRLDLLSCRNVLIYFGQALQRRVLAMAHYCLNQPGYLLLGRSESAVGVPRWFTATGPGSRVFLRTPGPSSFRFAFRAGALPPLGEASGPDPRPPSGATRRGGRPDRRVNSSHRAPRDERAAGSGRRAPSRDGHGWTRATQASAHDELVSTNEELQSLNEELETAKEELQASNEELTTLNDELNGRNRELQLANADVLNLLDAVEIPILMLDDERRLRRFTQRAGETMGLTPADVGRPLADLHVPVQAPDLEPWIARAMEGGILVESEVQDHADRWHRLQIRPHRAADGTTDGAILALVDIHDLKHQVTSARWAEVYARSIVEAVQVPLLVLDAGHRVLSANAAYLRVYREDPASTVGHGLFELAGGAWDTPALRRALAGLAGEGASFRALEVERAVAGASRIVASVTGCPVPAPSGDPMVLLSLEDVTRQRQEERHRTELLGAAEAAQHRAEQIGRSKDQFLANLSHELRTPLTSILLQSELLQRGHLDEAAAARAGTSIEGSTRRQVRLVEDLLDLTRIAAGKLHLSLAEVDWQHLVQVAFGVVRPQADRKPVRLEAEIGEEPPRCRGDPARLQQVLSNLLTNAVKFTPGGGRVTVRVDAVDGFARLTVADTGRGIDAAFLPHVFDRFAQEESNGNSGLGLGLAIVRQLVEAHGGTVRVESPGHDLGSTFTVLLPRLAVASPQAS